jgi:PEP-CTERM motif
MKKKLLFCLVALASFINCYVFADILLDDGETYYIVDMELDGVIYISSSELLKVDYQAPDAETVVNAEGYYFGAIDIYGKSTLNLTDFTQGIGCYVGSYENSKVNYQSGYYPVFDAHDNSIIEFNGGLTEGARAYNNSQIIMAANAEGPIELYDNSCLIITGGYYDDDLHLLNLAYYGEGLTLNVEIWGGQFDYTYATLSNSFDLFVQSYNYDPVSDQFTGILADGSPIDVKISSLDLANVHIVPEPATMLLLGLGSLLLRKRK